MQVIWYVAKLNHLRHGHSILACGQHVNNTTEQKVSLKLLLTLCGGLEILAGVAALIISGGIMKSQAGRLMLGPIGFMKSCIRVSPGWIGSGNLLRAITHLDDNQRSRRCKEGGEANKFPQGRGQRMRLAESGQVLLIRKRNFEVGSTADTVQRIQDTVDVIFDCRPTV